MRFRLLVSLVCVLFMAAACGEQTPPTLVVLIVTPTDVPAAQIRPGSAPRATRTPTEVPDPTVTPAAFPTPTFGQVQVAEQLFEHGRMFWIQPLSQIWVIVVTDEGRGSWYVYPDTFTEGEPEYDDSIVPPAENLFQPRRGFGKLWRENEEVREMMGWAVTPDEFGYISRYEYYPGGYFTEAGQFVPEPGYHILFSLYEEAFRFNETDQTWQLGRGEN